MFRIMTIGCLLVTTQANAQLFRRNCVKRVVVQQVVQQVIAAPIQTLFLVAPPSFYGAPSYTPPAEARRRRGDDEQTKQIVDTLSRVVTTLVALEKRVGSIETEISDLQVPPAPPIPPVRIPTIVQEQCSKCHTGDEPKGDFRLSDLGDPNKLLMSQALVANGKMPLDAGDEPMDLAPHVRSELFAALKKMEIQ